MRVRSTQLVVLADRSLILPSCEKGVHPHLINWRRRHSTESRISFSCAIKTMLCEHRCTWIRDM